jgi:CubicO group peptidase (beta-lactamase class C family)
MTKIIDQIDQLFSPWNKSDSPGCALAIVHNSKIVYQRGYGMANLEHDVPIAPNSVFDIGSTSKQFTAMCIALLDRQGQLSLNDSVQQYIPEISNPSIKIQHLIHHTSGLRDYADLWDLAGITYGNHYSDEDALALITRQKSLIFEAGTQWRYSNSGYFLLAQIVRRVSKKSLRLFAEEHIFKPLGMNSTHFHDDFTEIIKNKACGYFPKERGGFQNRMSLQNVVGAGGLHTTVEDLCRWDQNFYRNQLGDCGQDLIEQVTTSAKIENRDIGYGFGLSIGKYRGTRGLGHSGAWKGYGSQMIRLPDHNFAVICLTNLETVSETVRPHWLALQIIHLYLEQEFTEAATIYPAHLIEPINVSATELNEKIGFYRNTTTGSIREIKLKNETLMMKQDSLERLLIPIAANQFRLLEGNGSLFHGNILYEFPVDSPQMLIQTEINGNIQTSVCEKLSTNLSLRLPDYLGNYDSDELKANKQIILEDDQLYIQGRHTPTLLLVSIGPDSFFMPESGNQLEFLRDPDHRVIAFTLHGDSIGQLHFTKA